MYRQSKNINAPLEVKENESSYTEEKEEASFPDLSKDQKICKVIKSKVTKASKKENLSDGNQAQLEKCTLKYTRGLEKKSYHKEDVSCQFTECFFDTLKGDMVGEHTLPLNSKENFSSRPVSLGAECYLTPNRDEAEEKSDCAISEKQRKKPVDFRTVTIAEFGITQENFTKQSIGKDGVPNECYPSQRDIWRSSSPASDQKLQFGSGSDCLAEFEYAQVQDCDMMLL